MDNTNIHHETVETPGTTDRVTYEPDRPVRRSTNWLPLLIIPLLVLLGLAGYQALAQRNPKLPSLLSRSTTSTTPTVTPKTGAQVGVGGGPGTATAGISKSQPTSTPTALPTPKTGAESGVGGGPGTTAPSHAPSTGRGVY